MYTWLNKTFITTALAFAVLVLFHLLVARVPHYVVIAPGLMLIVCCLYLLRLIAWVRSSGSGSQTGDAVRRRRPLRQWVVFMLRVSAALVGIMGSAMSMIVALFGVPAPSPHSTRPAVGLAPAHSPVADPLHAQATLWTTAGARSGKS